VYQIADWLVTNLFQLFIWALLLKALADTYRSIQPRWKPTGGWLLLAESVYTLSDWVMWPLRKIVKPIRLGPVVLDLAWSLTIALLFILQSAMRNVIYAIFHYVG